MPPRWIALRLYMDGHYGNQITEHYCHKIHIYSSFHKHVTFWLHGGNFPLFQMLQTISSAAFFYTTNSYTTWLVQLHCPSREPRWDMSHCYLTELKDHHIVIISRDSSPAFKTLWYLDHSASSFFLDSYDHFFLCHIILSIRLCQSAISMFFYIFESHKTLFLYKKLLSLELIILSF